MRRLIVSFTLMAATVPAAVALAAPPLAVNVAEGQEATQSSTHGDAHAYMAVDGNDYGVYGRGTVAHTGRDQQAWWQVDLGENVEITEIVLWNRTDCCGDRLRDFHVLVSDDPFQSTDLQATIDQPGVSDYPHPGTAGTETRIPIDRSGRYVRVQLERREYLHLAEVEVLSLLDQTSQPSGAQLDLDVFVDGRDAYQPPGPVVGDDADVLVTYQVTNLGDAPFYALFIWDDEAGSVECPERTVDPGSRVLCEAPVPPQPGDHDPTVYAEAWTEGGDQVTDEVALYYRVEPSSPGLVNLALGKDATQSDSGPAHPASLAVDGNRDGDALSGSVAMTYRIVEAYWEVDLGEVVDIDHVVLWNRTDCCSERLRDFHLLVSDAPFELEDLQHTMTQQGVFDHHHREVAGRRTDITVGRTGRYLRVQAEYRDAIIQLAEVEVMGPDPVGSQPLPLPGSETSLDLQVLVNGEDADLAPGPMITPGDPVTFTYRVANTGTEPLWALYVWDDEQRHVDTCPVESLAPGDMVTCEVVTAAEAGQYGSRVEASAWDAVGEEAFDTDPVHYLGSIDGGVVGPALDVESFLAGDDADQPPGPEVPLGSGLDFTYEVSNIGTETLWALGVWHQGVGAADCPAGALAPGDTVVCTGAGAAEAGEVIADVFADAWDASGARASGADPVAYVGITYDSGAAFTVESYVNGIDADDPPGVTVDAGSAATFTYEVANTGAADLWALWLYDTEHGTIACPERNLGPGDTVTCELTAAPADGAHGGSVIAEMWDGAGAKVEAGDRHHYWVAPSGAGVDVEALVDGLDGWWEKGPRIREGQIMTRSFIVTNTGTVVLDDVTVTDDRLGSIDCPRDRLQPGEIMTCAATEEARLGAVVTWAHVTADAAGTSVSDDERLAWHVKVTGRNEQINLEVTVNGEPASAESGPHLPVGATIDLRYVVTNLGTWTSIYDIEIIDPLVPMNQMSCTSYDRLYLGSVVCTASVTVQPGEHRATVVANAWSANTPKMVASERVSWYGMP